MFPKPSMISDGLRVRVVPRAVRRAMEAMRADLARDWSMAELAGVAGVSSRTLQRQFREFLDKPPSAVLADMRLEAARRELLQGAVETRVRDIALRCGFLHFGRFAIAYRGRYLERPSATLKRQAVAFGTPVALAQD